MVQGLFLLTPKIPSFNYQQTDPVQVNKIMAWYKAIARNKELISAYRLMFDDEIKSARSEFEQSRRRSRLRRSLPNRVVKDGPIALRGFLEDLKEDHMEMIQLFS